MCRIREVLNGLTQLAVHSAPAIALTIFSLLSLTPEELAHFSLKSASLKMRVKALRNKQRG